MARPDPRVEPREYATFVSDCYRQHSVTYREGRMTEAVYRATLYALGWRGDDITTEVNLNAPDPKPPIVEKYKVVGGKVVQNR